MIAIPLTQGKVALIDDEDAHLAKFRWCVSRGGDERTVYAHRMENSKDIRLHRAVLGIENPSVHIDHINGNGLDCRRSNLRIASQHQNQGNTLRRRDNTSGFKGVSRHGRVWQARIRVHGHSRYLGLFSTSDAAARAYDAAARETFGAFAAVNFPRENERAA